MHHILTVIHKFADPQTASRIRRVNKYLSKLWPVIKRYTFKDRIEHRAGDKLHREDGPAYELAGYKAWYYKGELQREVGVTKVIK